MYMVGDKVRTVRGNGVITDIALVDARVWLSIELVSDEIVWMLGSDIFGLRYG